MYDQGYNMIQIQKMKMRESDLGILVATTTRNPLNIYILDRVKRKKIESLQNITK